MAHPFADPEQILSTRDLPPLLDLLRQERTVHVPTPEERFKWTLNGFIMDTVLAYGPVSTDFVIARVRTNLRSLRRIDGSTYTEDAERMVSGCLSITDLFHPTEAGWVVDPNAARRFREKSIRSIQRAVQPGPAPVKKPRSLLNKKPQRLLAMFQTFTDRVNSDPETAVYIQNPLIKVTGSEDVAAVAKQLGEEKAVGMVLAYSLMKECARFVCSEARHREDVDGVSRLLRDIVGRLQETEEVLGTRKKQCLPDVSPADQEREAS